MFSGYYQTTLQPMSLQIVTSEHVTWCSVVTIQQSYYHESADSNKWTSNTKPSFPFEWDTINTRSGTEDRGPKDPRTQGLENPRTQGPEEWGPKHQGPEGRGPEDQESWWLCCTVAIKKQLDKQNATSLTHGHVLYVIGMHTESIVYSRCYFKLSSDFFDPQCSLLSVLQSQTCMHKVRVLRLFACDLWPQDLCAYS